VGINKRRLATLKCKKFVMCVTKIGNLDVTFALHFGDMNKGDSDTREAIFNWKYPFPKV
jgi:hypothetical protein